MNQAPPTPKGFRDIDPILAKKRRDVINKIIAVLEEFGFVPIETPTIEFADTLTGKYGEEERLIYKFTDRGGRDLALRYDLTVPFARYVATYNPPLPFRRYQIGQVFRGENPQAGRYREFMQFDFDTVGSSDLEEDARIITAALKSAKAAGLAKAQMAINDRAAFANVHLDVVRAIDKIHKVEKEQLKAELKQKGRRANEIKLLDEIENAQMTSNLKSVFGLLEPLGLKENKDFFFDPTLARGLDYYTGSIFEMKPGDDPRALSIGSGGRYDNLIGMFGKNPVPAVGFSFGLDRLVESVNSEL